jgi:hypothetical protein
VCCCYWPTPPPPPCDDAPQTLLGKYSICPLQPQHDSTVPSDTCACLRAKTLADAHTYAHTYACSMQQLGLPTLSQTGTLIWQLSPGFQYRFPSGLVTTYLYSSSTSGLQETTHTACTQHHCLQQQHYCSNYVRTRSHAAAFEGGGQHRHTQSTG